MLVTIYCDASFKDGFASGAAWIRSNRGTLKLKGTFTSENSTHAEMQIAYLAIKKALESWDNVSVVFVNTDSLALCQFLWDFSKTEPKSHCLQEGTKYIKDICAYYEVEYRFKHVKGHQNPNKSIRAWLNNWCDEQASQVRRMNES